MSLNAPVKRPPFNTALTNAYLIAARTNWRLSGRLSMTNWVIWPTSHLAGLGEVGMDNGGSSAVMGGVLVIDPSGSVLGLLRSLDLGVPLWRVTDGQELDLTDIGLVVVAVSDAPDWESITELSDKVATVLLAMTPTHEDACRAVAIGALGYVDAHQPHGAMRRSILGAMQGEHAYRRRVVAHLIRNGRWIPTANALPLTPRQREVIMLIAKGHTDKAIGQSLGITTATAQKHVTNLLRRLSVPNRAAAVAAMSAGQFLVN